MLGGEDDGKDRSWINIRPGLAMEIEYSRTDYEMAYEEDEVDAKLTGRVRITRNKIFDAEFILDAITGEERD